MIAFSIYLIISFLLCIFYGYVITAALQSWKELPVWQIPLNFQPKIFISIIIPVRNEEANIQACLRSILQQSYPKDLYEIIIIDDHSTDRTAALVTQLKKENPQIRLFNLQDVINGKLINSYKKKAIELGVLQARGTLIVTTDGDCVAQPDWLLLLASLYELKQAKCIAAPVNFFQEKNLLERFQSLDYMGTMLLTGAGIHAGTMRLSNGANLAYAKAIFEELQGFSGINERASGDDMMLVQKIAAKYTQDIYFLKNPNATVFTKAKPDWQSFLQQRIRWATKSSAYREWRITFVLAMVFFLCCNILLSLLLILFFGSVMILIFFMQIIIKTFFDYQLLYEACRFFKRQDLMRSFLPAQALHIIYIAIIGFAGNFIKKYEWKGRRVR
ncbi:MAG: glycosyltransferase [Saprospiraceae bacterium]|nr:glycosyltransferase [Saprospiraceae bacterium]